MQELEKDSRFEVEALGERLFKLLQNDFSGLVRILGTGEASRLSAAKDLVHLAVLIHDAALRLYVQERYSVQADALKGKRCVSEEEVRPVGAVYEHLLGYVPRIAEQDLLVKRRGSGKHIQEECIQGGAAGDVESGGRSGRGRLQKRNSFFLLRTPRGTARKSSGAYYTPEYIVRHIVEETLGPFLRNADGPEDRGTGPLDSSGILNVKVLDPAMGAGYFLVAACGYLARAYAAALHREGKAPAGALTSDFQIECRRKIAASCLFGVDLDPRAVEITKECLGLFTRQPACSLRHRFKTGDTLFGLRPGEPGAVMTEEAADARARALFEGDGASIDGEAPVFLHWELAFPDVFKHDTACPGRRAGFSAVIGNPPYGDVLSSRAKRGLKPFGYPSTGGRAEISSLFILQGLKLLAPGGRLSFIVPNTLLAGRQFSELRAAITSMSVVESIVDYRRDRVFQDADVYAMILRLRAVAGSSASYDADYRCPKAGSTSAVPEKIRILSSSKAPWRKVDPLVEDLASRELVEPLSAIAECRDGGLDYKHKSVGWSRRGEGPRLGKLLVYEGERKHPQDRPLVRGTDIEPFRIKPAERYLIHDWRKYRNERTSVLVYSDLMEVPVKILTRQTSDRLVAAMDRERRYTAKSVHTSIVRNDAYTPEFICALLNSRVMNRIYMESTGERGRVFAQVKVGDLRLLPVRKTASYQEGLRHPEWIENRDSILQWITEGSFSALTDFAARLLLPMRDENRGARHPSTGIVQAMITEMVRHLETLAAGPDEASRKADGLAQVLDRLFSILYE